MNKRQLISLIIWWCEGTKPRKDKRWKNVYTHPIEVTNCDPKIIKTFVNFLRNDLKIPEEKLHAQIQIHIGDNQEEIENFWSKISGIPINQFNKTIVRPKGNKPGKNKGTFKVRTYGQEAYKTLKKYLDRELKLANIGD